MTKAAEILEECFRKVDNSAGPVSDHGAKSIDSKQDIQGRTHSSSKSESNPQSPYPEEWRVTINKFSLIANKNYFQMSSLLVLAVILLILAMVVVALHKMAASLDKIDARLSNIEKLFNIS